ncbi:MAG: ribonuclease R [Prevotella sp.]|nr:ribonuclease R [Staphylococcus sp.]MCM1350072.1 ribonuclease R [Prevotella sp.]
MKEQLLAIFESDNYTPSTAHQLFEMLHLTTGQAFTQLVKTLNQMEDEHLIAHNEKGQFGLFSQLQFAKGILDVKEAGFGFVDTEIGGIFIHSEHFHGAITYDEVLVHYHYDRLGRLEGEIVEILKRNTQMIIGPVSRLKGKAVVKSVNSKINLLVYIKEKDLMKAKVNDMVKVQLTQILNNQTADGKVVEVYGNKHLPGLDIASLVLSSGIPTAFSQDAVSYAKSLPVTIDANALLKENPSIRDLRDQCIITIDGDDAKDLDDAIRVANLYDGTFFLGVYIADVSHYVKEQSVLDTEALERGTSVYLPDRVIPMLPKELSNGICSLHEGVDRLVLACEMVIDAQGKVQSYDIFEAIIQSKHRMTYANVNAMLEEKNRAIRDAYYDIYPMLKEMKTLASILNQMRIRRGSFEFETAEPKLILDKNGKVVDIVLRKQRTAEKIIEEFMLIANETVAEAMTWLHVPFIYRVHEEPKEEKISRLLMMLNQFGYPIRIKNKKSFPKMLQQILLDVAESKNEEMEEQTKGTIVNQLMIRSMSKAKYQEYNIGHFGLASKCYTHFTSPIRRYPDLMVHRLIQQFLLGKKEVEVTSPIDYFANKVNYASLIASKTERRAELLERDTIHMKKVEYASAHKGSYAKGIISAITNFGMFITLDNTIEGLVKYNEMNDDYYRIDDLRGMVVGERTKKKYQLGDSVMVQLVDADIEKRIITFKIISGEVQS